MSAAAAARRSNGEGSVYFDRHSNRWVAAYPDGTGKRHKRTAATRKAARARLRELQDEHDRLGQINSPNTRLNELVELWKTKKLRAGRPAPSTIATKLWACGWIEGHLGDERVHQLSPDRVEDALAVMADEGLSRESLIKIRSVLNQVCEFGERRNLLRKNPIRVVELPCGLDDGDDAGRALTIEQAQTLLTASATHRLHGLWCTMTLLGLRPGEALGLHWSCIDFDKQVLHVRHAVRIGADGLEVTDQLKTARSRRSIAMPDPVVEALHQRRHIQESERKQAFEAWSTDWGDLVFTTLRGTPIHPSNLRREFTQVTEDAGLGNWTPNELRHTAVSILSSEGLPLERIADVVGHSGTRMTAKVYRHVLTPSIDHAVAPMNRLFAPAPANDDDDGGGDR